ncbi:MAG: hypothetical protein AABX84_03325 [Nanoarchaeota archaeon]
MRKRRKQTEQPLSEIIAKRRDYYAELINESLQIVYDSGNFDYIEKIEKVIQELNDGVKKGSLENLAWKLRTVVNGTKKDKRPILIYERYVSARDSGMSNEQIKEKYRLESHRQMSAFGSHYARSKKPN